MHSVEHNGWLAWNSVVCHHPCIWHSIHSLVFLEENLHVLDVLHAFKQVGLIRFDHLLLFEGHALHKGCVLADLKSFLDDEGSKLHSQALLFLVGDGCTNLSNILVADNCTILTPLLAGQNLEHLLLHFWVN